MNTKLEQITFADTCIDVVRKDIRNIYLRIDAQSGRARISAPRAADMDSLRAFALSKLAWIKRHQARCLSQGGRGPLKYLTGESHHFMGKGYLLRVIPGAARPRVEMRDGNSLELYTRDRSRLEQRASLMREWYRRQLKLMIPGLIAKWQTTIGVEIRAWGVKQMKTRWGSCNTRARRIWLNLELAKRPEHCLEYIIVHEILHLLERKHNANFKAHLESFIPNWREYKQELNNHILS